MAGSPVAGRQNRPNPPTGFSDQNRPNLPAGSSDFGELSRAGPASRCDPFRDTLIAGLEQGLSAQRIWQDLRDDSFAGGYDGFKRFVRHLSRTNPPPFRRMECEPGAEAQIDFGQGALIVQPDGKRKRPHAFRIVLSHSRKAYSEVVWRQSTEEFIRCIENAFWHFGGVPRTLVIDNQGRGQQGPLVPAYPITYVWVASLASLLPSGIVRGVQKR